MNFSVEMLDLDYLVFSSHKTATQTLTHTLRKNGYNCTHCHTLDNVGLKKGSFAPFLDDYFDKNNRKLVVITTFRDPLERHISSFFQWHGSKPVRDKDVENERETIIYKKPIKALQEQLIDEVNNSNLVGQKESISEICEELQISIRDLNFDYDQQFGLYESERIKLYIFRFDTLVENIADSLSLITSSDIVVHSTNQSTDKWYHEIYSEFKNSIKFPGHTIDRVYSSRRDLIELVYQDDYERIVRMAKDKYEDTG